MIYQSQIRASKKYRMKNKEKYREYSKKYYYKNRTYNIERGKINVKKYRSKKRKNKYCDKMINIGLFWAEYIDWNKKNISIQDIRKYINENITFHITYDDIKNHHKKFNKCLNELINNIN